MAKIMDATIPYNHPTEVNSIHFVKFNTYWD